MNVLFLLRYISGVLGLFALLTSAITYHPDIQQLGLILPPLFGGVALLGFCLVSVLGRLAPNHWVHQSKPIRIGLIVSAVTITLLLVLVG